MYFLYFALPTCGENRKRAFPVLKKFQFGMVLNELLLTACFPLDCRQC